MITSKRKKSLIKIRGIANFQFESQVGTILFPDDVEIICSKRTGRIRHIYHNGQLLATLKPTDGRLSLSIHGAKRLHSMYSHFKNRVIVLKEVEDFAKKGKTVFAKHVIYADNSIRAGDEVIVTNQEGTLLAVGKAALSGAEMLAFKRGSAVKVRQGAGRGAVSCGG